MLKKIKCKICPHNCVLRFNEFGKCKVRKNSGYEIRNEYYGNISVATVDSIEKRPFFHFLPRSKFLSVGFWGCSLNCNFCLPGNTLIRTKNGLKRIDQIQAGEEIFVFDNSNCDQPLVLARVGHVFDREDEEVIELEVDGRTIELTPEHPVMTKNRGWVKAENLTVDDEVLCDRTYLELYHYL